MSGHSVNDTEHPPELPPGISVFEPQKAAYLVLRTPDGTYKMEPERARDLGRLLLARTECYIEPDPDRNEDDSDE